MKVRRETLLAYAFLFLGLIDLLGLLGGALDIGERVLSSALLLFLWYKVDLPKHLFGKSNPTYNIVFLGIFFVLSLKNLLYHFGGFLPLPVISAVSYWSLILGFVALNAFLAYIALKKEFHRKSVVQNIIRSAQDYLPLEFKSDLLQFLALNFVSITFFLFVFDPISQWLIVSLDKSLLIIALAYLVFHARDAFRTDIVRNVSDAEESLIKTLLDMFKTRASLALALIVLVFLLSEIGFFLVPLFTGAFDAQITQVAGGGPYLSIMELATGPLQLVAYAITIFAFLLFVTVPAYLLINKVLNRKPDKGLMALVAPIALASFFFYFITSLFHIEGIMSKAMIGVTMWLSPIAGSLMLYLALSAAVFILIALGTRISRQFKAAAVISTILVSLVFFEDYFVKYFLSSLDYFSSRLLVDPLVTVVFTNYMLVAVVFFSVTAFAFMRFCSKAAVHISKGSEDALMYVLALGFVVAVISFTPSPISIGVIEFLSVLTRPAIVGFAALAAVATAARKTKAFKGLPLFFIGNAVVLFAAHVAFAGFSWWDHYPTVSLIVPGIVMLAFSWTYLKTKRIKLSGAAIAVALGLIVGAVSFYSGETATLVFQEAPWLWIVAFSMLTAIAEEAFFRGLLFGSLREGYGFPKAALLSSALFAAAHLSKETTIAVFASLFFAGLAFAWLREKHSIWLAVTAHFLSNVVLLSMLYGLVFIPAL